MSALFFGKDLSTLCFNLTGKELWNNGIMKNV
jgi:hypothetical protein